MEFWRLNISEGNNSPFLEFEKKQIKGIKTDVMASHAYKQYKFKAISPKTFLKEVITLNEDYLAYT